MIFGGVWWWLSLFAACSAEKWRFPETLSPAFQMEDKSNDAQANSNRNYILNRGNFQKIVQADDFIFQDNYYKKPEAGQVSNNEKINGQTLVYSNQKYPVKQLVEKPVYEAESRLDTGEGCTCRSKRNCNQRMHLCNSHSKPCCQKIDDFSGASRPEFFNELVDERPMLLPGQTISGGPFPPPPDTVLNGKFGPGHAPEAIVLSSLDVNRAHPMPPKLHRSSHNPNLLANPVHQPKRGVLVGPNGPTGIIGPAGNYRRDKNILGEDNSNIRPILTGPEGFTGSLGPLKPFGENGYNSKPGLINEDRYGPGYEISIGSYNDHQDLRPSPSAQRPILVGPGGPTGIIGPQYQRPILVGPGGPTGNYGPQRPILVGPGGPTGIIGPGYGLPTRPGPRRPVLVGPGGPTGIIGPFGF